MEEATENQKEFKPFIGIDRVGLNYTLNNKPLTIGDINGLTAVFFEGIDSDLIVCFKIENITEL